MPASVPLRTVANPCGTPLDHGRQSSSGLPSLDTTVAVPPIVQPYCDRSLPARPLVASRACARSRPVAHNAATSRSLHVFRNQDHHDTTVEVLRLAAAGATQRFA